MDTGKGKAGARGSFNNKVINRGGKAEIKPEDLHRNLYPSEEFTLKPAEIPKKEPVDKKPEDEDDLTSEEKPDDNIPTYTHDDNDNLKVATDGVRGEIAGKDEAAFIDRLIKEGVEVDNVTPTNDFTDDFIESEEAAIAETVDEEEVTMKEEPKLNNDDDFNIDPSVDEVSNDEVIEEGPEPLNEYEMELNKNDKLPQYIKVSPLVTDEAVVLIDDWNKLLREDKKKSEDKEAAEKEYEKIIAGLDDEVLLDDEYMNKLDKEYSARHYTPLEVDEQTKSNRTDILNTSFNYIDEAFETNGTNKAKMFFTKDIPVANAQKNPVAFMDGIVGNAKPIEVVFVNSGFRASFKYPKKGRRKRFQDDIAQLDDTIGAYLSTISMDSFEYIRINELIVEMAKELLISSTLNSPDPLAYITIEDIPILQAAILKSIFPNGLPFELMCMGNSILDPDRPGKTKCDKVEYGTVDPQQFIYTELPKVSESCKEMISRTAKNSVSIEEVENLLLSNPEYTHTFEIEGNEIALTFKNVLFSAAKDVGHAVLELVKKDVLDNFDDGDDKDEEELFKEKISTNAIKNNIFLTKVVAGGRVFDNPVKDVPVINALVESPAGLEGFYEGMKVYREARIVKAGIPAYTCGCGTLNGQHLGLRPINLVRLFTVAVMVKN